MFKTYQAAPDIDVLATDFLVPGLGLVPINVFVIKGPEPLLHVDRGQASGVRKPDDDRILRR